MIQTTLAQVQHYILQKNFLTGSKAADLTQLVERLGGLPAAPPTTPYLAAFARLDNFTPDHLLAELDETGQLIKMPLMRDAPYLVTIGQLPLLHAATLRQRTQALNADFRLWGVESNAEIEQLGQKILDLPLKWPATQQSISNRLPPDRVAELTQTSRGGRVSTTTTVALALRWLVATGALGITGQPTDWRTEQPLYAPLAHGYPHLNLLDLPAEAEAQQAMAKAYLAAFAPATEADISFWTGMSKSETARATGRLSAETTLVMVRGIPGMLTMLKSEADSLQATSPPAGPVIKVLPANDPFTTAHRASRTRYFTDASLQRRVFNSAGESEPVILVNGQVVGLWRWPTGAQPHTVTWQLLAELGPTVTAQIQTELQRVATFIDPQNSVAQQPD